MSRNPASHSIPSLGFRMPAISSVAVVFCRRLISFPLAHRLFSTLRRKSRTPFSGYLTLRCVANCNIRLDSCGTDTHVVRHSKSSSESSMVSLLLLWTASLVVILRYAANIPTHYSVLRRFRLSSSSSSSWTIRFLGARGCGTRSLVSDVPPTTISLPFWVSARRLRLETHHPSSAHPHPHPPVSSFSAHASSAVVHCPRPHFPSWASWSSPFAAACGRHRRPIPPCTEPSTVLLVRGRAVDSLGVAPRLCGVLLAQQPVRTVSVNS